MAMPQRRSLHGHSAEPRRIILGIETSCDDSCAAVVAGPASPPSSSGIVPSSSYEVLSQAIAHQDHSSTGGIHPYNATLSHAANLPGTIARALSDAGIGPDGREIDAIAVTQGPGMASSLGVGLTAAKTLAAAWNKDIIYVHHMAAHALTPLLTESEPPQFPFLTLLVSGGHTMLVLAHSPTQYRLLASTSDDSIGSGVKSSVLRYIETCLSDPTSTAPSHRRAVARAFQSAAVRQIEDRVALAFGLRQRRKGDEGVPIGTEGLQIRDLVCSGGVASNSYLRTRLAHLLLHPSESSHEGAAGTQATSRRLHFPPLALCTDNAVMIAFAAHLTWDRRTRAFDRHARPRWSLEDL
ncbi:Mitochondrial tRNAs modification protein [Tilletia horrida]|nr:Mitochondrial tRNAs modification protein [Tilletia horrida]